MEGLSMVVEAESTLLKVLTILHPEAKKNTLRRMVDRGRVRIDGERARRANTIVAVGQNVVVLPHEAGDVSPAKLQSLLPAISILYCDDDLIVVEKPAGLLSVATSAGESDTLFDRVLQWAKSEDMGRIFLVHRLDRETSGCMIFAFSPAVKDFLQSQFAERTIERIYHAVVVGIPENQSGTENRRIKEGDDLRPILVPKGSKAGKTTVTHWWVERTGKSNSLVRLKIETGRRAQIRLHMANIGHPVVGDTRHGIGRSSIDRLCLHASSLTFDHPSGEEMSVKCEIPERFNTVIKQD